MEEDITTSFNKYIGSSVDVDDKERLTDNNPVVKEIRKQAIDLNVKIRMCMPGSFGTADFRADRINVFVSKNKDEAWTITRMSIG